MLEGLLQSGNTPVLNSVDVKRIQELALSTFGLDVRAGKEEMITARLAKVMRERQLYSFKEYYNYVVSDRSGSAVAEMVDALTTNYTSFFREPDHFELLNSAILQTKNPRPIRIWSAACSSGEEPYTIAFCCLDSGRNDRTAEIVATDISNKVLEKASLGVYRDDQLASLPSERRRRYFLVGAGAHAGWFKVRPEIRNMISFTEQNLIQPLRVQGAFDAIFLRNVLIYFNKATQQHVVQQIIDRLGPNGHLFIGHAETLNGLRHGLHYVRPAVYRKGN